MQGKTHLAVGVLAAVAVARPQNLGEAVLCVCTAAVGGLISDVDVTRSEAKNRLDHIVGMMIGAVVVGAAVNKVFGFNAYEYLTKSSSLWRIITGLLIFIGICIFGESTPHRSFMHSLVGVAALSIPVSVINPHLLIYFVPAMLSHIVIDTLNRRPVMILYPIKKGIAFKLCKSDGLVSKGLCYASAVVGIGVLALSLYGGK